MNAPLQGFGDMVIKSITNGIKRSEGKQICACWWLALLMSVSECVWLCLSVCMLRRSAKVSNTDLLLSGQLGDVQSHSDDFEAKLLALVSEEHFR